MKMTIGTKLISLVMAGSMIPLIVIGLISYNSASTSLKKEAMSKLTAVRESRKAELLKYDVNRDADIEVLAKSSMALNALEIFKSTFQEVGRDEARKLYIFDNPYPLGQRHEYIDAKDDSNYTLFHTKYHPYFKHFLEKYTYYYDLFLVDAETGDIVYTVYKEDDFGTNLYTGKYRGSAIAELARKINLAQSDHAIWTDYKPYEPSDGVPARFTGFPILNDEGKRTGILMLQLSIDAIDAIMTVRSGLGESGETYLVGPDTIMRSNSRFSEESTVLKQKVDTEGVREALNGQSNTKVIDDYRGVPVLSAYAPIEIGEQTWAIIAEVDEAEALAAAYSLRNRMLIIGAIIASVVGGFGFIITRRINNLLKDMVVGLSESSTNVAAASEQLSASSQGLSQGTTEQAASVEETTSSMEEMSSMTKQNSDNAGEAAQLASLCNTSAEEGAQSMFEMNKAMNEIDQSSKKIGDIIRTIDSIAFQTNLLALNAAVEAARAGEHGKGFAVVAEEVRSLAQKSAAAAKDTSSLIQESLDKTATGTGIAKKCTESFENIVTNIKKMSNLVNEISAASQEQAQGVDQVSKAVQQIDQALQDNAANAEETAATGEQLSSQSQILNNLVSILAKEVGSINGNAKAELKAKNLLPLQDSSTGSVRSSTKPHRNVAQPKAHNRINQELFDDEVHHTALKGNNGDKGQVCTE
ncbi:MAG: methyl-accepting chemotaxis protein [Candidatus Brocadiales bacterium]